MSIQHPDTIRATKREEPVAAKPKVVTEMLAWMMETGRNDIELAKEINEKLGEEHSISARQVFRWKRGLSYPRPVYAVALEKISGGRINALTFARDALKKPGDPPDGGG